MDGSLTYTDMMFCNLENHHVSQTHLAYRPHLIINKPGLNLNKLSQNGVVVIHNESVNDTVDHPCN